MKASKKEYRLIFCDGFNDEETDDENRSGN